MTIDHIAIYVSDLEKSRAFYEKYFAAKANDLYCNSAGLRTYFLSFDSGARLELMYHPSCEKLNTSPLSHGLRHLSFAVGSREKVDSLTAEIAADGYDVLRRPRVTGDGYYESVVLDNDGNQIEITI